MTDDADTLSDSKSFDGMIRSLMFFGLEYATTILSMFIPSNDLNPSPNPFLSMQVFWKSF